MNKIMLKKEIKDAPKSYRTFFTEPGNGKTTQTRPKRDIVFSQGDDSDAVFFTKEGKIRLSVRSERGKEAVVADLGRSQFFGEACLVGQIVRNSTATTMADSIIVRYERNAMMLSMRDNPKFSQLFMTHLLSRNIKIEKDLVDQLFNSSEKRLARLLLLMAHFGKESKVEAVIPEISQASLAEMIGISPSKVSFFMNRFEKLGFIDKSDGLRIHSSLLNIVLLD